MTGKHNLKFYDEAADYSRTEMINTLRERKPDDPTMIPEWRVRHLAAHLYVKENTFFASLGTVVGPLAGYTQKVIDKFATPAEKEECYQRLVDKFAHGPLWYSPFRLRGVKRSTDIGEFYVHTEDILRANKVFRKLSSEYQEALWNEIVAKGAFLYRGADVGVIAAVPGGERHVMRKAPESVAIIGEPGEILLHAFGRGSFANVRFQGDDDAVAILNSGYIGL